MAPISIEHLTPLQKTLLVPLKARAAANERSLLDDHLPADLLSRIDGNLESIRIGLGVPVGVALRSRILDRAVASFRHRHRDAVVVELGSGLETRRHRMGIGPEADWYDVDHPEVIALRESLLPGRSASSIACSLLDPAWADAIPTDRPTILVADGVLGFLTEPENRELLHQIATRFSGGELAFSAYTPLTARLTGHYTRGVGMPPDFQGFGFDDPHRVSELEPQLTFVDEETIATAPETGQLSGLMGLGTRVNARLLAPWPSLLRSGVWVVRYSFGSTESAADHSAQANPQKDDTT